MSLKDRLVSMTRWRSSDTMVSSEWRSAELRGIGGVWGGRKASVW